MATLVIGKSVALHKYQKTQAIYLAFFCVEMSHNILLQNAHPLIERELKERF